MCNNKLKNMKKIFAILVLSLLFISCDRDYKQYSVRQEELPEELKGIKIHLVPYGENGGSMYVATLNDKVNSLAYQSGKHTETVIMINNKERVIHAKEIISETDSILVIKK